MIDADSSRPFITVIVPTRNEAENIHPLLQRLGVALADYRFEALFVDDSDDDTPAAIAAAVAQFPFPVRLIARPPAQRNGLSGAVVEGLRATQGEWAVVMDGDLQHPPELLPLMAQRAQATQADIVVGSRLAAEQGPIGLSAFRSLASRSLTVLARAFFPQALRNVSDPLTGLFMVRRAKIDPEILRPQGFKILLEILARCRDLRVTELHFEFGARHAGESKAGLNEVVRFFRHLLWLRLTGNHHFSRFLLTGAFGLLVNTWSVWFLTAVTGLHYLLAAFFATQISASVNFILTERWVFADRRQEPLSGVRLSRYLLMNNILLIFHLPLMAALVELAGLHYLLANLAGILAVTFVRYALSDEWIWTKKSIPPRRAFFSYDIHGLLAVSSTARLPGLEFFRVETGVAQPDIQVTVDHFGTPRCAAGDICYDERLGRYGFGATITLADCTQVVVSPLLEKAPHALYTNVVEPLLRWALVRQGCAFAPGTAVAHDDAGSLLISRSQPEAKSILRAPPDPARAFLGDELAIVTGDGRLLAFPKPLLLTIRQRQQADGIAPHFGEWLLLAAQSRIYTWWTRRIAIFLRRLWLPAATLNALAQTLFPPPRYMLHKLRPQTRYQLSAQLSRLLLVEPVEDKRRPLAATEAAAIINANLNEIFSFPPYPQWAERLSRWDGVDLTAVERQIIAQALAKVESTAVGAADVWRIVDNR